MTDIVYVVRPGDTNPELRFSLRTIAANLPHGRVWLAGHCPTWVRNVEPIAVPHAGATKWRSSTSNLLAACLHPDVSDPFVLCNDDFFVMAPLDTVPVLHRGPVAEVLVEYDVHHQSRYVLGMRHTAELLARHGHPEPLSYELHVPLPVSKAAMAEAIELGRSEQIPVLHKRTLYGNLAGIGGSRFIDVKVSEAHPDWSPEWPLLSTDDRTFATHPVGCHIRASFRRPCRYEA